MRPSSCGSAFHDAHEARFGFAIPGEIIEIVNYTATVVSRTAKPELPQLAAAEGDRRATGGAPDGPLHRRRARRCRSSGARRLRAGHALAGPALIEEAASVTVVEPGQRLTVDAFGHLLIDAAALRETGRCGSPRTATTSRST